MVKMVEAADAPLPFKERQRRLREEAIVDAAEDVLTGRGPHALSMDDVAARVGIAKGTIYLHFASKDALLAEIVARGIARIVTLIDALDPARPALERLSIVMRQLLRRHVDSIQGMSDDMQELRRIFAADARCADAVHGLRARLGALVDEGKQDGEIDSMLPTLAIVGALFALLSPRSYARMLADGAVAGDDLNDALVRLYLKGIARDPSLVPTLQQGDGA